jgi:hypothetical protein
MNTRTEVHDMAKRQKLICIPLLFVMTSCGQLPNAGTSATVPVTSQPHSISTVLEVAASTLPTTTNQTAASPVLEGIELDNGRYQVEFVVPQGSREAPLLDTQDPTLDDTRGDQVLSLRSWFLEGCACSVYLLVQRDPGPNAAVFKLPSIATFETKVAKWSVADIGDQERFYMTAIATVNGLLVQVTGNGASLAQIEAIAGTVTVERIK